MSTEGGAAGAAGAGDAGAGADAAAAAAAAQAAKDGGAGGGAAQFTLPDAYKEAPWAKDFKSTEDVFKSLENAQQFIGRKGFGVPGEKATDEDRAAFYKELGVPEDEKGYEFTRPDTVPEELWNNDHDAKWSKLMRENNVPKGAASALRDAMLQEQIDIHNNGVTELNKALDATFGADKKLAVGKEIGALLTKAIPDVKLREQIEANIGNKHLPAFTLALGQMMNYFKEEYGQTDTNTGDEGAGTGKTPAELRAEAQALMKSEAWTNPMHKDNATTRAQVKQLYDSVAVLQDAEKKAKK